MRILYVWPPLNLSGGLILRGNQMGLSPAASSPSGPKVSLDGGMGGQEA